MPGIGGRQEVVRPESRVPPDTRHVCQATREGVFLNAKTSIRRDYPYGWELALYRIGCKVMSQSSSTRRFFPIDARFRSWTIALVLLAVFPPIEKLKAQSANTDFLVHPKLHFVSEVPRPTGLELSWAGQKSTADDELAEVDKSLNAVRDSFQFVK